jgi:cytochrome b561
MQTTPARYDGVSILLHWIIALGIIAIAAVELLRGELFAKGSAPREVLKAIHDHAGTVIFALILLRLVWRATHAKPALPAGMRYWERSAAKPTHVSLYPLMGGEAARSQQRVCR